MYTVVFLDKRTSLLLREHRFLFAPFESNGNNSLAFCNWNEHGDDLKSAVPDLDKLIKGRKKWRAVIINMDSIYNYDSAPVPDLMNVFDYSAADPVREPHESSIPLIRLTHILGGYRDAPTMHFTKGFEYYNAETGTNECFRADDYTEEEIQHFEELYGPLEPSYVEEPVTEETRKLFTELKEKYSFSESRPTEILLVATSSLIAEDKRGAIDELCQHHIENASSYFWDRNYYPTMCRFLHFPICSVNNSFYKKELTDFWFSVLTLAINEVSPSSLQAYRLYRFNVEFDAESFSVVLNRFNKNLKECSELLAEQALISDEYSFEENEDVLTPQPVSVIVSPDANKKIMIETNTLGLSRNCPVNENTFWDREFSEKCKNIDIYIKSPRREIDKSATYMRRKAESFMGKEYILDRFQVDDLNDSLVFYENEVLHSVTKNLLDRKQIREEENKLNGIVKTEISKRMYKKSVKTIGIIAMILAVSGLIPYIIVSASKGIPNLFGSLAVSGLLIGVMFAAGILVLLVQRSKLISKINQFNVMSRQVMKAVTVTGEKFSRFFSNVLTYMKGKAIFDGIRLKHENDANIISKRNAHKKALAYSIDRTTEWLILYGLDRTLDINSDVLECNFDIEPKNNSIYFLKPNTVDNNIPFNRTGEMATSPYSFISRLCIERVNLFDDIEEGV